jgi:hypothetical protein
MISEPGIFLADPMSPYDEPKDLPMAGSLLACCARAASGHAAAPPSATSNFRRPMVTVIRPSRARRVKETIPRHERAVPNSAAPGTAELVSYLSIVSHIRTQLRDGFPSVEDCRIDCCGSWARQRVNCRIGPPLKFHRVCFVDCPAVGPLNDRTGGSDPRVDAGNL